MSGHGPRWGEAGLVALGGSLGTAARYGLDSWIGEPGEVPWGIGLVNVAGAFLLGLLTGALARGPQTGRRQRLRMLLGTGAMGGFTTYSLLALDTVLLLEGGRPVIAVGYALASLVLGVVAAAGGLVLGRGAVVPDRAGRAG